MNIHIIGTIKCLFRINDYLEKNISKRFEDTVQIYIPNDNKNWFMYTMSYNNITQKLSVFINQIEVKSFIKDSVIIKSLTKGDIILFPQVDLFFPGTRTNRTRTFRTRTFRYVKIYGTIRT